MNKIIVAFILLTLLLTGCQKSNSSDFIEDGVVSPSIVINGSLYGPHQTRKNQSELDENFTYYGTVQSVQDNKLLPPTEELQVSKVLSHCIGYKVYLSDDHDEVAIFIESLNEYAFLD